MTGRPLTIFVHRASEHLTNHDPHGDGLICFSLLDGLARRGHTVFAYTDTPAVEVGHPRLIIRGKRHRVPANSLGPWEQAWRADRWLRQIRRERPVDLVWRMHPYGVACPVPPATCGLPLVLGPLFYDWPTPPIPQPAARPRLGIGIAGLLAPLARRGWRRTLRRAALVICSTPRHADVVRVELPGVRVESLPVIVEPSARRPSVAAAGSGRGGPLRLLLLGNLQPNKNPLVFCETIRLIRAAGRPVEGLVVGDGPERPMVEAFLAQHGLSGAVKVVGRVPHAEVGWHIAGATFHVSASVGEPYGRNIVEAMAAGVPSVCHASGGPADLIAHGRNGLLVERPDPAEYAATILTAWDAPGTVAAMSGRAFEAAAHWTADAVLGRLEQLLAEVVGQPGLEPGAKASVRTPGESASSCTAMLR